jgi:hypothetical protein
LDILLLSAMQNSNHEKNAPSDQETALNEPSQLPFISGLPESQPDELPDHISIGTGKERADDSA